MKTINNQVHLIGNLGKDINLVDFKSGTKKAEVSLATNHNYRNSKGEYDVSTQWHRLVGWGSIAELMGKSLAKGSKVAITGSLKYRTYESVDGVTKHITEIVVTEFMKMTAALTNQAQPTDELVPF